MLPEWNLDAKGKGLIARRKPVNSEHRSAAHDSAATNGGPEREEKIDVPLGHAPVSASRQVQPARRGEESHSCTSQVSAERAIRLGSAAEKPCYRIRNRPVNTHEEVHRTVDALGEHGGAGGVRLPPRRLAHRKDGLRPRRGQRVARRLLSPASP